MTNPNTPDALSQKQAASAPHQLPQHELLQEQRFWKLLSVADWLFAALMMAIAAAVQILLPHRMDIYEVCILWLSAAAAVWLGWFYKPLRLLMPLCIALAYAATVLYAGQMANGERFLLRYFLASQSAIGWLCALVPMAWLCYALGLLVGNKQTETDSTHAVPMLLRIARYLAWAGAAIGLTGMLVRWHESYLLTPGNGHIPLSNLYEVFILFIVITALMFLYYEGKFRLHRLGVFVYTLQLILVGFVLWYTFSYNAQQIRPLIPALQSWWMKLHVPANFIGYGAICLAAFLGVAELMKLRRPSLRLPEAEVIEEAMYQAIAIGFLFFTVATVLGALWAADAWGRYWSWDPKENWALVVWLNYAAWLHIRLVRGWGGKPLAWWAIIGFFITAFAFVGVNMFLGGLHSYGGL